MASAEPTRTPLTGNLRADGAMVDIAEYQARGGYAALRKALTMAPADVVELVKDSNLRGRGGAGFPTGQKWSFVPMGDDAPHPKYMVCNADEMEPGAFKDRRLLEGDPHQMLEGLIISAWAVQADVAYVFLRWAYKRAARHIEQAIAEAAACGYIGGNILGTGWSLELHLHVSAGRYMCGEETALLNALEGKRANPRSKPPFPQVSGAWGKPTVVNNVETLCNIPHIVEHGAAWFQSLGRGKDAGTKLYGASGYVKRPGLWELPIGTPMREILEEHAGGMQEGHRFRAALPGGASTEFVTEEQLDVAMDFDSMQSIGSRLGTGTMIVLDDRTCPVGMVLNLEHFFAQESCGWCTPCWGGLSWIETLLRDIEEGRGETGDLERLLAQGRLLAPGHTYCALAPGAAEPLNSALVHFRDDFERHIHERCCPWK